MISKYIDKKIKALLVREMSDNFVANVFITNNTPYAIIIQGVGAGNTKTPILPNQTYKYSSSDDHNTKSLLFMMPDGKTPFMQGNLSFSQFGGVYVDRGWEADQTISMNAAANGQSFIQNENGGKQLLAWDEFENGGDIYLDFISIKVYLVL